MYSKKENVLYILSDVISPNTKGMALKERIEVNKNACRMSYEKRLEMFCSDNIRKEIQVEINNHPGCILSEFCNVI
jgi:hypothetical protein